MKLLKIFKITHKVKKPKMKNISQENKELFSNLLKVRELKLEIHLEKLRNMVLLKQWNYKLVLKVLIQREIHVLRFQLFFITYQKLVLRL